MKKLILVLLSISIFFLVFFLALNRPSKRDINLPIKSEEKEKLASPSGIPIPNKNIYQCSVDEDCVLVSMGECCEFVAVNKNFKYEINQIPMSCTAGCNISATCNKGVCRTVRGR